MKHILNFFKPAARMPDAGILCLTLALAAGTGCGKPKNAETPAPPPAAVNSTATPAADQVPANQMPSPPPPASINLNAKPGPNSPTQLQLLNRALLAWRMNNHRRPKTFEEFASTAGFQIPTPPAGKKYVLSSSGFIVLVNSN